MPTLLISLIGCYFHQDESLDSLTVLLSLCGCRSAGRINRLHLFAGLIDLSRSLPIQSEALILGIIHYELGVTKIGSKR